LAAGRIQANGTLQGDLWVVGQGDPSWNERRLGTNFLAVFDPFIAILTKAGIKRIQGDVQVDATLFKGPPTGAGWNIDDLREGEGAMVSAVMLHDNIAQVEVLPGEQPGRPGRVRILQPGTGLNLSNLITTGISNQPAQLDQYWSLGRDTLTLQGTIPKGSAGEMLEVAVPRPADWFAAAFKAALALKGIAVKGKSHGHCWPETNQVPAQAKELGGVLSPPLREVVAGFMKPSQNLETDTVLAFLGEHLRDSNTMISATSASVGLQAVTKLLTAAGVEAGAFYFDEGSGLSRNNLTTASATAALLQYAAQRPWAADFRASLPVGGVDGTLRRRFKNTPAMGNLQAKTGTLRWTRALSGYLHTAAGEPLVFSIYLNRFAPAPGHSGHDEIDPLILWLAGYQGHIEAPLTEQYAAYGSLLVTQLVHAPFPHPAREQGHAYQNEFFPREGHYDDASVAIFVPCYFQPGPTVDVVVHCHGWRHTLAQTLTDYQLIEQFCAAGRNAILVIPQGPKNAADSFGGKLEDTNGGALFLSEVLAKMPGLSTGITAPTLGRVILSGHSGAYHALAALLDHGGLEPHLAEVWLFDALYGGADTFQAWQNHSGGRLIDLFTDHGGTAELSRQWLAAANRTVSSGVFAGEDMSAALFPWPSHGLIFLHSDLNHSEVLMKRDQFRRCLETSCLLPP
ncbi:MAG TPA: D-alanyl-D-alanine carboxypeptidase/D-alanyl-D-alanine-endopeptidase, partial [Verrucomicrobiae bacterium]